MPETKEYAAAMVTSESRQTVLKVARWLVSKQRAQEALEMLSAWAAQGPNDAGAQELMAEALRIQSGSPLAKMAFEAMEGVPGDHALLEAAIVKYTPEVIEEFAKQMARPNFNRAQLGFNNNVKYKDTTYHIQTEDSGVDRPHVITHLFADGGRIIKSHKREYASELARADLSAFVRTLMKGQHVEMAICLREGTFDDIIAGTARGGMEVLTVPPRADIKRGGGPVASDVADEPAAKDGKSKIKAVFRVQDETKTLPEVPKAKSIAPPEAWVATYRLNVERATGGSVASYEPKSRDGVAR
jgi:hypothetical protein